MEAINPFVDKIPDDLKQDFMTDCNNPDILRKPMFDVFRNDDDKIEHIRCCFDLMILQAKKVAEINENEVIPETEAFEKVNRSTY